MLFTACKEKETELIEYRIIKNESEHDLELFFEGSDFNESHFLNNNDSLIIEGICRHIPTYGYDCKVGWDDSGNQTCTIIFDDDKELSYERESEPCLEDEKNILARMYFDVQLGPATVGNRCGYIERPVKQQRDGANSSEYVFIITEEDYLMAE